MGEISIWRGRARIRGAPPAFAIPGPHSEQILAKWKREVRSLGVAYEEVCYAFLGFTHFVEALPHGERVEVLPLPGATQ
jgi:hypothetical protein